MMTQEEIYFAIKNSSRLESKAIELLFKQYFPKAKAIAIRHLAIEDAQDIFQDCITDLCFKIKNNSFILTPELPDGLQRFIFKYTRFKSLALRRKNIKFNNELPFNLIDNEVSSYKQEELVAKIFEIAESKSPRGAEVMRRRFINKESYKEISTQMSYSANSNSAKNQLHRVVKEIRSENIKLEEYLEN
ncbi:MAG TPA: hypothetical protein VNW06_00650 [Cytophagaceae bacterium]|jgi:DNA-directed RNA polymerase specialized sigma24 family protein|nr:hypothetical protein [Cytophagaceae bacterium]